MTTAYTETRSINKLYRVDKIFDKDLAAIWIKDGTLSIYSSYSNTIPTSLAPGGGMTLDNADVISAEYENPAKIGKEPTYLAFTGTATEIRTDYIELTDLGDIL